MGCHVVTKLTYWCDRCGQIQVIPPQGPQQITEVIVLREGHTNGSMLLPSDIEVSKHLCSSCLEDAMQYIKGWNMDAPRAFLDSLPSEAGK